MKSLKILAIGACCVIATSCQQFETPTDPQAAAPQSAALRVASTQDNGNDPVHVTGSVDISSMPFDLVVVDRYQFSAIAHRNGGASGQFEFRATRQGLTSGNDDATVRVHGQVTCVAVFGNKARMGGVVTQSNFEEGIPVGTPLTWSVTDGGKDDTASQLLGAPAEPFCQQGLPFTYPEFPTRRGNVQIH